MIRTILVAMILIVASCSNQVIVENYKKGQLNGSQQLDQVGFKDFLLDGETAAKPYYMEITKDSSGVRQFTFLNEYNNSIYFYQYDDMSYIQKISFEKEGVNAVELPMGYHIKNMDSIYVYSRLQKVVLANAQGEVKHQMSLSDGYNMMSYNKQWAYKYPEFYVETVTPFIPTPNSLLLTGQFSGDLPDEILDTFNFTAQIDYRLSDVAYMHGYPYAVFGDNVNWGEGLFMEVFPALHHSNKKMVYSFPTSHDLFVADIGNNSYEEFYGGSNFAGDIYSIDRKSGKATAEEIKSSFVRQDMYAAIIHDKFRKVYYRFLRKALPNASVETSWKDKTIAVILMDEDFDYLGETILGTERNWHWQNSFVTKEGLNIEYVADKDVEESNISLKIFLPKKNN